jgi:hypothetical protein
MMITSSKCRPRNSAVRFWLTLHATRSAYGRFCNRSSFCRLHVCFVAERLSDAHVEWIIASDPACEIDSKKHLHDRQGILVNRVRI